MLASKSKSGLSDASNSRTPPAIPKVNKLGRTGSTKSDSLSPSTLQNSRSSIDRSPKSVIPKPTFQNSRLSTDRSPKSVDSKPTLQNSRSSVDRSPKSVESKPTVERRTLKISKLSDKQPQAVKGSDAHAHLGVAQDDLKKAREQLVSVEQEKAQALQDLQDAKRLTDEANEKLKEALVAQKKAEESSEIEKFRAVELEQAGIEAAQKREDEWQKEIDNIRNQHAADVAALLSTTQELQKVKHELALTSDEKNTALSHADDAMKIVDINAEKVESLSREVSRLKAFLDSKMESISSETAELVKKLHSEVDALKHELERAKAAEDKLVKMEALVEGLRSEVADAKRAEMDAGELVYEWKNKAETFEVRVKEANRCQNETTELIKNLNSEVHALKRELEKAKAAEDKLVEMEALAEGLRAEVTETKRAEMDAGKLVDEWKRKAEALEVEVEEAKQYGNETSELVKKLDFEVDGLKHELNRAKAADEMLVEMDALVEQLRSEVNDAKRAEMDAAKLVDKWKRMAELLEVRVEEATQSEKSSLDSLSQVAKQLEESNALLQDAGSEIADLKGIIESLEIEVARHKEGLDESDRHLDVTQQEVLGLGKMVEALKSKLQESEEEKLQAVNNEKVAASNIKSLTEERNKLINELEISRDEEEKAKEAMEGLASALHEVSTEARETQERLLTKQAETEDVDTQIEELKSVLKNTEESYEVMLDEARYEIVCLRNSIERYETEANKSRAEWNARELKLVSAMKKSEEEVAALKAQMGKVVDSIKGVEHEAKTAKESGNHMLTKLRQAESGVAVANETAEEAKAESSRLKERLLDKENELQSITQENDELRIRESDAREKVRELSALLSEVTAKKTKENSELTNSEEEYDLLPIPNTQTEYTDGSEAGTPKLEVNLRKLEGTKLKDENVNGNLNKEEEPVEVEAKMWGSFKVMDKGLASEREHEVESTDDELDSQMDSSNGLPIGKTGNGGISPSKSQQRKKKKDLLHKFGSLLKKKSNHK